MANICTFQFHEVFKIRLGNYQEITFDSINRKTTVHLNPPQLFAGGILENHPALFLMKNKDRLPCLGLTHSKLRHLFEAKKFVKLHSQLR